VFALDDEQSAEYEAGWRSRSVFTQFGEWFASKAERQD
jgi:hypothetical protein